jgi:hypothetical protein
MSTSIDVMETTSLTTAVESDDPAVGLRSVVALRRLADQLETRHVSRARALGWSWEQIGDALGVSRQAVHKKHGRS